MITPGFSPYVEISLDNLLFNVNCIRSHLKNKIDIIAVVKDSSYGCGAAIIANTLEHHGGISFFAVARCEEAFSLRKNGVVSPILVLGRASDENLLEGSKQGIIFGLTDLDDLDRWQSLGHNIRFHLLIDTGMCRMGIMPSEIDELADRLARSKNLSFEGAFTHFAKADEPHTKSVDLQLSIFRNALAKLKNRGFSPTHIHYGNSAMLQRFPIDDCTMVRPGISLYGCKPDPSQQFPLELKPVVSLKSTVVKVKKVPSGTAVSYCGNYTTTSETFIATVALGYGHGLPRFLGNRGEVLIRGKRFKIAGNVTMDYIMVDVGQESDVKVGDEVVAIGRQGDQCISPDDIACLGNTIGYEIICNLSTTIDRYYLFNGSVVLHEKGICF